MKAVLHYDDRELIAAIGDKNELNKAIQFIYQHYAGTVSSFIVHYGAGRQDAEDVFQETVVSFIDIVAKGKFRMESSVKTFLVSVAKNIWFNEMKKRDRAGHREKQFEQGRDQKEPDIGHLIGDLEKKKQLRELVYRLGEPCRKILMLFYYENLSMKELVDHLPYENEQVIRNKKYKCLQQLTGFIRDHPLVAAQINETLK
jgi:RNA polymerase sigma factor (sigma-70 family)